MTNTGDLRPTPVTRRHGPGWTIDRPNISYWIYGPNEGRSRWRAGWSTRRGEAFGHSEADTPELALLNCLHNHPDRGEVARIATAFLTVV